MDTHVSSPIEPGPENTSAIDRTGDSYEFYKDVPVILHAAREVGITMALASRTHAPELARKMLGILHVPTPSLDTVTTSSTSDGVSDNTNKDVSERILEVPPRKAIEFFEYQQIFPGDKRAHMKGIQQASKVGFEDMLFFDDESRNRNVEVLGVTFCLVNSGVSVGEIDRGIREWRSRRGVE